MKETLVAVLAANPILLLFLVCAIGFALGRIPIGRAKVRLGIASIIFVGLAFGALDPRLKLPPIVNTIGIVLFMYTVGLTSSAGFFGSLNRKGLRDIAIIFIPLVLAVVATYALARMTQQFGAPGAAIFSGAMSNASGLAAILDAAKGSGASEATLGAATVNYSLTYLCSFIVPILVILFGLKVYKVDLRKEAMAVPEYRAATAELENATLRVTFPEAANLTVEDLSRVNGHIAVVVGRIVRNNESILPNPETHFELGDRIVVVGTDEQVNRAATRVGERAHQEIDHEQTEFEYRRLYVSEPAAVGIPLDQLNLPQKLGIRVTRVRRGDAEFIPDGHTRLEYGDRLRVLAQGANMPRIRAFFGDSLSAVSEVDFLSLGLGITFGLLLGLIPFPLPGGLVLRIGVSGGPLVAALLLARVDRTAGLVWAIPYSANLTLRQLGLILFAAGIGTQAGYDFFDLVLHHGGIFTLVGGTAVSVVFGVSLLLLGRTGFKVPMNHLLGVYAGGLTQPIVLDFAKDQAGSDLPSTGYAAIFPMATVIKIVLGQVLLAFLR